MRFSESAMRKVDLINAILAKNGSVALSENPIFQQNQVRKFEDYTEYLICVPGAVTLNLIISPDSIQLDIDDMAEVFEWSNQQIDEIGNNISEIIEMVFTSSVEIERCGSKYRKISFRNREGRCVRIFKYISGFYVPLFCKIKNYHPIFPTTNLEN